MKEKLKVEAIQMELYQDFLNKMPQAEQRQRVEELLNWVMTEFPNLKAEYKWNQPMFTDHGTYIIGFSVAKHHLAVAPEVAGINQFKDEVDKRGLSYTQNLVRLPFDQAIPYDLLKEMIAFNQHDKADHQKFWR